MKITLTDGSVREFDAPMQAMDVIRSISQGLARAALAIKVNDEVMDVRTVLEEDCTFTVLTFDDAEGRAAYRHTTSHIFAQAVKRLYPDAQLAIGPAIDNGFYYDFGNVSFSPEDLEKIEAEMAKIVKEDLPIERFELPREEAIALMEEKAEPYKVELIQDLPEDAALSFYRQGEFVDLCAGPHLLSTGKVKAFKLMSLAGAYWRGSEKNAMLQRVYGTAFDKKSNLDEYLARLEEAKKRDHRKLGRELDLFSILEEGPGFPFFHPKGMILRNELENFWRELHAKNGYQECKTPMILNEELWHRSGHWDHYKDNMYTVKIDDEDFAIKPMNCPGGMLLYKRRIYSYRDLPVRMGELGLVHRHELSGALHGLMRVRCFTQDDAHIFMTPDQIQDEIKGVIDLTASVYEMFGFKFHVELSTRPEDSMGSDEDWEMAINALKAALNDKGLDYEINEGDGAFYGPKIDFHLEDCLGRTWQCGTIQLDFQMPERFDLTYVGADGAKHRPVMIHRVVFGSIERFIGILTEHFAGAFPVWLNPVQARIMTITSRADDFAHELEKKLSDAGIRVECDVRNEKIGFKIREAQAEKIPYMLVLGDKEVEEAKVNLRKRGVGIVGTISVDEVLEEIVRAIKEKEVF